MISIVLRQYYSITKMSTISDDKHFYAYREQSAKLNPGTYRSIHINIVSYINYLL